MKLDKPVIFFDLETTGVDTSKDRIVQIATVKLYTDGTQEEKEYLINPEINIPKEASDVHGITNEMVENSFTFSKYANSLHEYFKGCAIGGYNSNSFDVPLLMEEFKRCGIKFDILNTDFIDVMKLEMVLQPRTLSAVYQRYTGKELEDAHNATADVKATIEILKSQIEKFELTCNVSELDEISQGDNKRVDLAGKLTIIKGEICWNFGKHKEVPVKDTPSYVNWFLKQSVPTDTRDIILNSIKK